MSNQTDPKEEKLETAKVLRTLLIRPILLGGPTSQLETAASLNDEEES